MIKVLVTGAAGFIPSSLIDGLLSKHNYEVIGVDNFLTGQRSNLTALTNRKFKFIRADVNDYKDILPVFLSHSFDYVFHYAAVVGVKRTLQNPLLVLRDIEGFKNILSLSKSTSVKRVFFSSSSEVYGEPFELPQNETTTPLNSRLPYAIVKNVGEAFLRSYQLEHSLDYTIFRFFNTYGPRQSSDFVMTRFIKSALRDMPLKIYGDGLQTRTFCFIQDNIDATISCIDNSNTINQVINIGSEHEITIAELARVIISIIGSKSKIVYLPALGEGDMTRRCPDNARMKEILQRPLCDLETGIRLLTRHLESD